MENNLTVLTGAGGSLGKALCKRLIEEKHHVVAILKPHGTEIPYSTHNQIISLKMDLANTIDYKAVSETVESLCRRSRYSQLNLIHTAAIFRKQRIDFPCTSKEISEIFQVNCVSVYTITQTLLPWFRKVNNGTIIGISSNLTKRVNSNTSIYTASKYALEGLIKQLAYELGRYNTRCNIIAPGYFRSNMSLPLPKQKINEIKLKTPLGRIGTTADIVQSILLLLSSNAKWVTGQTILSDGGNSLGF